MQGSQRWRKIYGIEFPVGTVYPPLGNISPEKLAGELLESLPVLVDWISEVKDCVSEKDWDKTEEHFKKKHPADHAGLRAQTAWAMEKIINSSYRFHSISPTGALRLYPVTVSRGHGYDSGDGPVTDREIKSLERFVGPIPPDIRVILEKHNANYSLG